MLRLLVLMAALFSMKNTSPCKAIGRHSPRVGKAEKLVETGDYKVASRDLGWAAQKPGASDDRIMAIVPRSDRSQHGSAEMELGTRNSADAFLRKQISLTSLRLFRV